MAGTMVLTGRAKDTIVLSSGENIEPSSIEDAVMCSPLIKFCVLLGQDRRSLGGLIVLDPEALEDLETEKGELSLLQAVGSCYHVLSLTLLMSGAPGFIGQLLCMAPTWLHAPVTAL